MTKKITIRVKRIYDATSKADGCRILVDRLWPRGMKKEDAHIDKWMKNVAPSTALRKWFGHDPKKWEQFRKKYYAELERSAAHEELLAFISNCKTVTFLFSSKEEKYNHAQALQQFINNL